MIKIGIIGGAGYTAGELVRLLINHPEVKISWIHSESNAGNAVTEVHGGLTGDTDLVFTGDIDLDSIDCLFLCSGHGASTKFWESHTRPAHLKVVDLAQDFRDESCGYVYGLPELQREKIKGAGLVANPGCFATAIQLGLLPLAAAGKLSGEVAVTGITGSTGAGVKPSATTHFSWRNDNLSVYKPFTHQHLAEIGRSLAKLSDADARLTFIPVRGDFPRGIFVSMTTDANGLTDSEVAEIYSDYYRDAAFTRFVTKSPDLKQVTNTNKALVWTAVHDGRLLIVSIIDNLLKGASGQAVQNMNLMFGLPEDTGLKLKPSTF